MIGAAMVVGGILGAAVLSVLSDRLRRRKPFLVLAVAGMAPGLVGLAFATSYPLLLASAFVFGFFLMSAYPVGFQYSAEVSYPAPEATSQGLMIMAGQVSGILFILGMDAFRAGPDAPMTGSMVAFIALTAVIIVLASLPEGVGDDPRRRPPRRRRRRDSPLPAADRGPHRSMTRSAGLARVRSAWAEAPRRATRSERASLMVRVERATGRVPARLLAMALTGLALLAGCSTGPGVPGGGGVARHHGATPGGHRSDHHHHSHHRAPDHDPHHHHDGVPPHHDDHPRPRPHHDDDHRPPRRLGRPDLRRWPGPGHLRHPRHPRRLRGQGHLLRPRVAGGGPPGDRPGDRGPRPQPAEPRLLARQLDQQCPTPRCAATSRRPTG